MNKQILIIGAGPSGLMCGIEGQKKGYKTVIYEKNNFSGGNLTGWFRKNCYIDNCIHWLNGSKDGTPLNILWKEIKGIVPSTSFYQSDYFYQSEYENKIVGLNKDINITKKEMLDVSPQDKKQIEKFIRAVELFSKINSSKKTDKIKAVVKLLLMYGNKTINQVAKKFKSPLLKKLITDYIIGEYSIYTLLLSYNSFTSGDGNVLKDGSLNMAKRIEAYYKDLGGEIYYNSEVEKVNFIKNKANGITLKDGNIINSDYVICCSDAYETFNRFISNKYMPKQLKKTYSQRKFFPIISSFHIAYKINGECDLPDTIVFETLPIKIGATNYTRIMLRSYNYGINFTPDNSYVLQVFLLQREKDYDYWSKLSSQQYKEEKERVTNEITNAILGKYPQLFGLIEFLDCWTPYSYTKYFNAYKGSYMSFGITKKLRKTIPNKVSKLKNLYIATQWQSLFGGLPNAIPKGVECIKAIKS